MTIGSSIYRKSFAAMFGLLCMGAVLLPASADALPYQLSPTLSLVGNCTTSTVDPIPDPSCPYPPPPDGPSGRFDEPRSIAIDAYGNEYVASYAGNGEEGRIDVFDAEGKFLTELADPSGPKSLAIDTKGNLYVFEHTPGSETEVVRYAPTVYEPEAGNIEYGTSSEVVAVTASVSTGLAVDFSNDHLYIAEGGVILEYSSAAEGNELLDTIGAGELSSSSWVAVDAERRRLYASSCRESGIFDCVVLVFEADAPHNLIEEIDGSETPAGEFKSTKGWTSIAVDEESGHFFVEDLEVTKNIYEFNENYEYVETLTFKDFEGGNALQIGFSNSPLNEEAANRRFLFVPRASAAGRALAFEPPGVPPADVLGLGVVNIGETEAELEATIDPNSGETEYVFEYTTRAAFEERGFEGAITAGEGIVSGKDLSQRVSTVIRGLSPGVSYHFRIRAENESGGEAAESAFTTYSDAPRSGPLCVNQVVRVGASGALPDCRAYELVTPPDTNGRPPVAAGIEADRFATVQSSSLGDALSFVIIGGALPGSEGTGGYHGDLYRADRGPSGWGTGLTGPTSSQASKPVPGSTSPDQGFAFWVAGGEGSAVTEGGNQSRWVRYPDGHSELIGRGSLGVDSFASGRKITENGTHIIFATQSTSGAPIRLEPDAPPTGTQAIYDRTADEVTHVVSLLPGNVTPAAGEHAHYLYASADGNGIAFEIADTLYLRKDNAVTYEIGENVEFAGVSDGGERIFYVEGGDLLAFDTDSEEVIAFSTTGNVTPVNVAPGGTRAYFVSPSVLGGGNPNGAVAQAGKENLYLSEEGSISFVGTVTDLDVEGEVNPEGGRMGGLGLWTVVATSGRLGLNPSRLTPDGSVLLFQSRASLDGQPTGAAPQIHRYDAAVGSLECISCIPTQVPEGGGASLMSFNVSSNEPPFRTYGFVQNLRADGKRAFFESSEALVSTDTDKAKDVYEWEAAGVGTCARPDGCIYLISSGQSARDDFLYGHSTSGDDVFFTTADSLTGFDAGGTISIYDARVGGGFPEPNPQICEGEGCPPGPTPAPALPAPPSGAKLPSGNVPKGKKCPKGKRKVKRHGKVVCVKKKKHRKHKQRKAGSRRGATR